MLDDGKKILKRLIQGFIVLKYYIFMTQKMTHLRREVHHVVYRPGESNLEGISINSFHKPQTQERERKPAHTLNRQW